MKAHVSILGWMWAIMGMLGIFTAISVGFGIAIGDLFFEEDAVLFLIAALACGGLFFLESILNIIIGVGLHKYKSWARTLAIIFGIFSLFAFPIGTALGIYTLWIMFNDEAKQLFEHGFVSSGKPEENGQLEE